jgi:adenylate kinase
MKKIFLGPPGSGKGTTASRIAPIYNVQHISTGDLLRKNIQKETEIGKKAKEHMQNGELVPDEIVVEMLKEKIFSKECKEGFILDGFPRTIPQAEMLEKITDIDVVVNIDVPDEIIIMRNSSRISCPKCGRAYNFVTMPPKEEGKCNDCNENLVRRKDDEPNMIKKRLQVYNNQTKPLIEFYKNKGILKEITCNSQSQTPEEICKLAIEILEKIKESK